MTEIWKDIAGYEGLYQVSNLGQVRSVGRIDSRGHFYKSKILSFEIMKKGYKRVSFCIEGKIIKKMVHRLVAETFLPNENNLPEINHKDGNKSNNIVTNLEWCTTLDNIHHAFDTGLRTHCSPKKVVCVETGEVFPSIVSAAKWCGSSDSRISNICSGKSGFYTAKGFHWRYAE